MNDLVKNPMGQSLATSNNGSSATADSNRAIAEVQAALTVAMANPRDQLKAVDRIINAFARPGLAESSQYQFSRGGTDIKGPSIRSAEAIAQQWGNFQFGFRELSRAVGLDGVGTSEVSATAWDMETNAIRTIVFHVKHWRDTKRGGYALTDERDIYELVANQGQRRVRSCILAIIPADVVECAMQQADLTLKATADCGPDAMKKMLDAFSAYDVTKEQIEAKIQRRIDAIQPAQVVMLKRIYASLRDGMSFPSEWFEAGEDTDQQAGGAGSEEVNNLNDSLKTKDKKQATKKKAASTKKAAKPKPEPKPEPEPKDEPQPDPIADPDSGQMQIAPMVTYADMMDSINKAETRDIIDFVVESESYALLPADQKMEIARAAEQKILKLG